MKCLIVGGAGFVGSNLAESLDKDGHEVMIFDNFMYGKDSQIGNLPERLRNNVFRIDVKNSTAKIEMELQHDKPDIIFHLAARSSAPQCTMDPVGAVETNVCGFQKMLEAAYYFKVNKVVYASTSSMYNGHRIPYNEEMCIQTHSLYESTFHARESIAFSYFHEWNVNSVGLRFFSVYGPHESHKKQYANNITQFIWDIKKGKQPVVFGNGNQSRDFVYVDDVVEALKLAAFSDVKCDIFNVGTGNNHSFNEIIKEINTQMDTKIYPEYRTNPLKNYVLHTKADITKIHNILKWSPYISMQEGIRKQIEYYA